MTLLVTGGTGFVMSTVARHWLDRDPDARAVILDRSGLDAMAEKYFAGVQDRLSVIQADILDSSAWSGLIDAKKNHRHRTWRDDHAHLARQRVRGKAPARSGRSGPHR